MDNWDHVYWAMQPMADVEQISKSSPIESPEKSAIKLSLYETMSEETKDVVLLIINAPKDFTRATLIRYLKVQGWTKKRIDNLFSEMREFLKETA